MHPHSIDLRLAGVTLHGFEWGTGPVAVLLHGITANAYVFLPLAKGLAADFSCVSLDQRGHGRSSKPALGYDADAFAADTASVIRKLGGGPALLVGHSLGARNALITGLRYPSLVAGVVAIDFTPFIETAVFDALDARVAGGDQVFEDEAGACAYLAARYPGLPQDAIERRARFGLVHVVGGLRPLADVEAMRSICTGLRADLADPLKYINVPTLLIRGERSKLVSVDAWRKTKALRPDLRALELAGCDHYVPEEDPAGVAEAVRVFWRETLQSRSGGS